MHSLPSDGAAAAAISGVGRSGWGGGGGKPVKSDRGLKGVGAGKPCFGVLTSQRLDLDALPGLEWELFL